MTAKGRLAWEAARLLALTGAFHLLPTRGESDLTRAVGQFVGPKQSVAISYARGGRRGVALVLGEDGRPISAIKVALDAEGRHRLAREAEWLLRLDRLLEPPLFAPRVLQSGEGIVVIEAVAWLPRWRPWQLPVTLAHGIGRFHVAQDPSGQPGNFAHGDFAPWNVMRTNRGWMLLDWEEARLRSAPYADPLHYLVQSHALLGRPRAEEILAGLQGRGWVGEALDAYAAGANLAEVDRRRSLVEYLRSSMPEDLSRPDHLRGIRARRDLLQALGEKM